MALLKTSKKPPKGFGGFFDADKKQVL